ncbi:MULTISPECIES: YutD family protein [Paenibacillus]|uniref:YutD family protein n=1 Tax=Paenibacillus TaxID=44249 RepID=UPI0022B8DD0E|nr:YutD family protein [Paenibacillus caseinilyticus]MCZ8522784.1 YutD family protein [Paenibacillus caseinilyticus]
MIHIAGKSYEVIVDHKNGWRFEAFRERYSEVLERYDYIVGDWGYSQLRLRGFFKDNHPKVTRDTTIATLQDYLNEYCNFGCAYFIIEKVASKVLGPGESYPEGIYDDSAPIPVPVPEGEGAERPAAAGTETGRGADAPAAQAPSRPAYQPNRHGPQNRERGHGGRQGGGSSGGDHQGGRGRQGGSRGGEGRQGRPQGSGSRGANGSDSRGHQGGGKQGRGPSSQGGGPSKPKSESSRANV